MDIEGESFFSFFSPFVEREVVENEGGRCHKEVSLHLSSDTSVMGETIQSLPLERRTLYPKRWTTENMFAWVTGWSTL